MKLRTASLYLLTICLFALPAVAQNDIYDNGPSNGTNDGWTINFGFAVSNTFTLSSNSTLNGLNFTAWVFPGDVLQSVEIDITSDEFGGTHILISRLTSRRAVVPPINTDSMSATKRARSRAQQ